MSQSPGSTLLCFIELGPKRALTGMMRELAPAAEALAVSSPSALEALALT